MSFNLYKYSIPQQKISKEKNMSNADVDLENLPSLNEYTRSTSSGLGDSEKLNELLEMEREKEILERINSMDDAGSAIDNAAGIVSNDSGFLNKLGRVESGNNYFIKPNANGYEGKYQYRFRNDNDAGMQYAKRMGVTPDQIRKSPRLQENMMQLALNDYKKELSGSGLPVNDYTLWLRHNQGLGGANAILRGHLTPQIRRNIRNQGVTGKSDIELLTNYHSKFKPMFS